MKKIISSIILVAFLINISALSSPAPAFTPSTRHVEVSGGSIEINFEQGRMELNEEELSAWVSSAARTVAGYFGHFPLRHLTVIIRPRGGRGVHYGNAVGYGGNNATITAYVGGSSSKEDLDDDWVMVHEMFHLGFPSLPDGKSWMEEGLSTYLEPLARARMGNKTDEDVWREFVSRMPEGIPRYGDGLDYARGIGPVYWGGALFYLLADVEIREKTKNRKGLEDALRSILAAGGNINSDWEAERVVQIGDKATGVPALKKLYERMSDKKIDVDLADLWKRLGIEMREGKVTFNDRAPLASVRRSITRSTERSHQRSSR